MDNFKEMIAIEKEFGSCIEIKPPDSKQQQTDGLWMVLYKGLNTSQTKFNQFKMCIEEAKLREQTNEEQARKLMLENFLKNRRNVKANPAMCELMGMADEK